MSDSLKETVREDQPEEDPKTENGKGIPPSISKALKLESDESETKDHEQDPQAKLEVVSASEENIDGHHIEEQKTWRKCVAYIFFWLTNSEMWNFITHLVSSFAVIWMFNNYIVSPFNDICTCNKLQTETMIPMVIFFSGELISFTTSALYHLIAAIGQENAISKFIRLDFVGISLAIFGKSVSWIMIAFDKQTTRKFLLVWIAGLVAVDGIWTTSATRNEQNKRKRISSFSIQILVLIVAVIIFSWENDVKVAKSSGSLIHLAVASVFYAFGLLCYTEILPCSWLKSHALWHLSVSVAAYIFHQGLVKMTIHNFEHLEEDCPALRNFGDAITFFNWIY